MQKGRRENEQNYFGGRKREFASATLFMHDSGNRNFKNWKQQEIERAQLR